MTERVAVITGANTGIGYHTAAQLARRGYTVVMACRSRERADEARARLLAEVPGTQALVIRLDLAEPGSIQAFRREFDDRLGVLDLLINNAGIVGVPLTRNSVGHELQLATNYLGPFALTAALLPSFRPDTPTRIVNVGSLAHRVAALRLDDFNWERRRYEPFRAYARSKLAMLAFTLELSRRLRRRGSDITRPVGYWCEGVTMISRGRQRSQSSDAGARPSTSTAMSCTWRPARPKATRAAR